MIPFQPASSLVLRSSAPGPRALGRAGSRPQRKWLPQQRGRLKSPYCHTRFFGRRRKEFAPRAPAHRPQKCDASDDEQSDLHRATQARGSRSCSQAPRCVDGFRIDLVICTIVETPKMGANTTCHVDRWMAQTIQKGPPVTTAMMANANCVSGVVLGAIAWPGPTHGLSTNTRPEAWTARIAGRCGRVAAGLQPGPLTLLVIAAVGLLAGDGMAGAGAAANHRQCRGVGS
jgi:hypothetical protein